MRDVFFFGTAMSNIQNNTASDKAGPRKKSFLTARLLLCKYALMNKPKNKGESGSIGTI